MFSTAFYLLLEKKQVYVYCIYLLFKKTTSFHTSRGIAPGGGGVYRFLWMNVVFIIGAYAPPSPAK